MCECGRGWDGEVVELGEGDTKSKKEEALVAFGVLNEDFHADEETGNDFFDVDSWVVSILSTDVLPRGEMSEGM